MAAGRKSKYSPERVKLILDAIRVGSTYALAAAWGGISDDTLDEWKKKYSDFAESFRKAEGEAALKRLARIDKAGREGDWRADAWWMERRYPDAYGKTVHNEISGPNGGPIAIKEIRVHLNLDTSDSRKT